MGLSIVSHAIGNVINGSAEGLSTRPNTLTIKAPSGTSMQGSLLVG